MAAMAGRSASSKSGQATGDQALSHPAVAFSPWLTKIQKSATPLSPPQGRPSLGSTVESEVSPAGDGSMSQRRAPPGPVRTATRLCSVQAPTCGLCITRLARDAGV